MSADPLLNETVKNIMNMLTETLELRKETTDFHAFTLALNKLREMLKTYGEQCYDKGYDKGTNDEFQRTKDDRIYNYTGGRGGPCQ